MSSILKDDTWVWVIIQDPEKQEEIVGQQYEDGDVTFIPTFQSKEDALQCMNLISRLPGKIYEPQAIIYEDLVKYAQTHSFAIFLINGEGEIKEKING